MTYIFSNPIFAFLFFVPVTAIIAGNITSLITNDFSKLVYYISFAFVFAGGFFYGLYNSGIEFSLVFYKIFMIFSTIFTFICTVIHFMFYKLFEK